MERFFKGLILFAWIGVFGYFTHLFAIDDPYDRIAKIEIRGFRAESSDDILNCEGCSPQELLRLYTREDDNFTLVGDILNSIITENHIKWYEREPGEGEYRYTGRQRNEAFQNLFMQISTTLSTTAKNYDHENEIDEISIGIPYCFVYAGEQFPMKIKTSNSVQTWMKNQHALFERTKVIRSLVSNFTLLVIIGGFGGLIFLMRDYINANKKDVNADPGLSAYLFRPILGMFLAIAVYMIDLFAHAVISESSLDQVRMEPLYLLAFAAGLLCEQAYEIVSFRADEFLKAYKAKKEK